jgi:hypothetical protein
VRNLLLFSIWLFIAATCSLYASLTTRHTQFRLDDFKSSAGRVDAQLRAWDPYLPRPYVKRLPEASVAAVAGVGALKQPSTEQSIAVAALEPPTSLHPGRLVETTKPNLDVADNGKLGENPSQSASGEASPANRGPSVLSDNSKKKPGTLNEAAPNAKKVVRAKQLARTPPRKLRRSGLGLFALSGDFGRRGGF